MKIFCFLFALLEFIPHETNALGSSCAKFCYFGEDPDWVHFKTSTGRVYQTPEVEYERYFIFQENMQEIAKHNEKYRNKQVWYDLKMNSFGDLTPLEFRTIMFGSVHSIPNTLGTAFRSFSTLTETPRSLDLRTRGMVSNVKNQGYSPTGGIFSAIGVLESVLFKQTNKLVPLSEQHVLDCAPVRDVDPKFFSFSTAMTYLKDVGSITEKSYPFEGKKGECRQRWKRIQIKFPHIRHVAPGDTVALETVLDKVGPVSIQMPASSKYQFYNSGVFNQFRHPKWKNFAALIVGYGTDPNHGDYWLVKNSWGDEWGEKGYIRLAKHENDPCVRGPAHFADL